MKFDQTDSLFHVLWGNCARPRVEALKHVRELGALEFRRSLEESGSGRLVRPGQDSEEPWQKAGVPAEPFEAAQRAQVKTLEEVADHHRFLVLGHLLVTVSGAAVQLLEGGQAAVPSLLAGGRVGLDGDGGSGSSGSNSSGSSNSVGSSSSSSSSGRSSSSSSGTSSSSSATPFGRLPCAIAVAQLELLDLREGPPYLVLEESPQRLRRPLSFVAPLCAARRVVVSQRLSQ